MRIERKGRRCRRRVRQEECSAAEKQTKHATYDTMTTQRKRSKNKQLHQKQRIRTTHSDQIESIDGKGFLIRPFRSQTDVPPRQKVAIENLSRNLRDEEDRSSRKDDQSVVSVVCATRLRCSNQDLHTSV